MKRVMAKQVEAERERRATIIRAEGELTASENLNKAMKALVESGAISLRSLQTIENATDGPNNTIIMGIPMEILDGFKNLCKEIICSLTCFNNSTSSTKPKVKN